MCACGSAPTPPLSVPSAPPALQTPQVSSPAPTSRARAPIEIPLHPQTYHLQNGLTAILIPDATADVASVLVRYGVGAVDDPTGQEGIADLAAHVSYASVRTGKLTLWDELDAISTRIESSTRNTTTDFSEACLPEHLEDVLKIEARRLEAHCDGLTKEWFNFSRKEVSQEVRVNNTRLTNRAVYHTLYPTSDPTRHVYDATPDEVDALTGKQTCAFIGQHYGPRNAVIVVSGPIDPHAFETMLNSDLAKVPTGTAAHRAAPPPAKNYEMRLKIAADVTEPTLAISWPLPTDEGERGLMLFGADTLARNLKCDSYSDDNQVTLWVKKSDHGGDSAIDIVKSTLRSGLITPGDFEHARSERATDLLLDLDLVPTRLRMVADGVDLQAPFRALQGTTIDSFDRIVATDFAWDKARVLDLVPDGTRPVWRPTSLQDPAHPLRGPSSFPASTTAQASPPDSHVLAGARSFQLSNGLNVVIVPTTPIPVIDIALAFRAGNSLEPSDHRGTAAVALSALEQIAKRGKHPEDSSSAVGSERSGVGIDGAEIQIFGPTINADLLMSQFEGLAHETFQLEDVKKGHDAMVRTANARIHQVWDEVATLRGSLFGPEHPYSQATPPDEHDVTNFDERAVEAFYRRYLQPNNASLVITGGFDPDVLADLVHRTFDGWQGNGQVPAMQAPHSKPAQYASEDQRPTVRLEMSWLAETDFDKYAARQLLAVTLNAMSARVRGRYTVLQQAGMYVLTANFEPSVAAAEIKEVIRRIPIVSSGDPYYRTAFEAARRRAILGVSPTSSTQWASWIVFWLAAGRDVKWLAGAAKRYAAVTYEQAAKLAKTELAPQSATLHVSGPHDDVAAVYAALGIQPTWISR
jgi:zinc protease